MRHSWSTNGVCTECGAKSEDIVADLFNDGIYWKIVARKAERALDEANSRCQRLNDYANKYADKLRKDLVAADASSRHFAAVVRELKAENAQLKEQAAEDAEWRDKIFEVHPNIDLDIV